MVGGRDDMMVNILWKNLENVGRSGTERSETTAARGALLSLI